MNDAIALARRACETMMRRFAPQNLPPKGHFHYHQGVFLWGMLQVWQLDGNKELLDYARGWLDAVLGPDGTPRDFVPGELDDIQPGNLLFPVWEATGDPRYRWAMDAVYAQYARIPRRACGGYCHKPDLPGQMWLDGLYMGGPFLARYAALTGQIFPNDFDDRNKNEYGTTDDRFEYIELINTADTPVNLTTDYELVYGTKADNAKPFAVQETDGSDVVLQPGEVTVVWNQRTNVKNPGTVEDFRSNYMIPDNVHIVISQYGKDWANTGYFGLRARATGTVCADYSYVNGTIDKNDGKDIADGLGVDLAIPNVGYSMTASTKKTAATPGYAYSEQRGGNTTAPAGTEGLYVTEIYPNDGDRSAVYGVSDDLMEFVEVTNTTDHDIDFNADYQFQYIYKTQFTRLTVCTVEDAHKEALGEVTRAELDAKSAVIPAHSSAVFWCYRESWLTGLTQPFPDEAAFRAAYNMPEDAPLYCVLGQNGMKNTDRAVGISHAENGRQVSCPISPTR